MPILGVIGSGISSRLWAPAGAYDSISTATVTSGGTSSITFSSIPQTYTHLQIRGFTLGSVTAQDVKLQFNSDTATNYSIHYLQGNGTGAGAAGLASQTYIEIGITGTTTSPSGFVTDILDYTNTNKNKTARSLLGYDNNGSGYAILFSGYWNSTTAISTITLTPYSGTFNQYSSFSLYGIK